MGWTSHGPRLKASPDESDGSDLVCFDGCGRLRESL